MIQIGDRLPDATLYESTEFGEACPLTPKPVSVAEATKGKRIVIFGLPGAYTPTCSAKHVPGYVANHDALKAKKRRRDLVRLGQRRLRDGGLGPRRRRRSARCACSATARPSFTKKLGLEVDLTAAGMGVRMRRFSMLVDDGVVKQLNVEAPGKFEVSNAETMLGQIA